MILAAVLTLLGLVIGFTFSMSLNRFDQRKNFQKRRRPMQLRTVNIFGRDSFRHLMPSVYAGIKLSSYTGPTYLVLSNPGDLRRIERKSRQIPLSSPDGSVVRYSNPCLGAADTGNGACRFGHERCVELPGIHTLCLVEPYTVRRMAFSFWGVIAFGCVLMVGYSGYDSRELGEALSLILPLFVSISFLFISDIDRVHVAGAFSVVQPRDLIIVSQS